MSVVCGDFICLIAASRVVNINGQSIPMSSKLCGVGFYDISKILRPQMCLGGLNTRLAGYCYCVVLCGIVRIW